MKITKEQAKERIEQAKEGLFPKIKKGSKPPVYLDYKEFIKL